LHIIARSAGAGDNRTICRGRDSGNCFGHCDECLVKLSRAMQWSPEYQDGLPAARGASVIVNYLPRGGGAESGLRQKLSHVPIDASFFLPFFLSSSLPLLLESSLESRSVDYRLQESPTTGD